MEIGLIFGLILFYFYTVTCAFIVVRIAALKGRKHHWGWLGVLLGLLGVLIACFLPNAKGVKGQTNPIKKSFKKFSGISSVAVWIVIVGVFVIVGGVLLGNTIATAVENRAHEKELVLQEEEDAAMHPTVVYGTIADVFCGNNNQFAITEEGHLYGWGKVPAKALGESDYIYKNAKKICATEGTLYVLTKDGDLYGIGDNRNHLIPDAKEATVEEFTLIDDKVKEISLSETVGAYIKESGNLYVFGVNTYFQLGTEKEKVDDSGHRLAEEVVKVVATNRSLYYMLEDKTVYAIGNNAYGQFGRGDKESYKTAVRIGKNCKDFAAGDDFTLLWMQDGRLLSAGNNASGQLGRQTLEEWEETQSKIETVQEDQETPDLTSQTKFGAIEWDQEISKIAAGGRSAYVLTGEKLYGWGDNHYRQMGKGAIEMNQPTLIHKTTADFSAGRDCVLVLTQGGRLMGAGDRRYKQLGSASGDGFEAVAQIKEAK